MKPVVSLITPTHRPDKLLRLYESIEAQTCRKFEWVVIPNNGADVSFLPDKKWIKIIPYTEENKNIGALKNFGFSQGSGQLLAEVDHDDELTPNCVEVLVAHKDKADFLYSNNLVLDQNGEGYTWGPNYNWKYSTFEYKDRTWLINKAFPPYPGNFAWQWWAPNHIRVWNKEFYHRIGGHDKTLKACDDGDLICRTMIHGTIHHIDRVLYVYYLHPENSHASTELKDWIENYAEYLHYHYMYDMAASWSKNNNLHVVRGLDVFKVPENSAGLIIAPELSKIPFIQQYMQQAYKVLAPGGIMSIHNSQEAEKNYPNVTEKQLAFWANRSITLNGIRFELNGAHKADNDIYCFFTKYVDGLHIGRPKVELGHLFN